MLIQRLAGLLCAIAVVGAAALSTAISARADDSVTASDGWVSGRVTKEEPGHNGEQTRRTKDTQPSTQSPPYYDPLDCVRPVGAGAAVDCERDLPEPASGVELLFVPPTEAEVRVALHLPDPTPRFGPDPSVNEWKMLAVGYPIWLWTDAPTELSATATHDGLSMTLRAEWTSTSFEMGDGHTVTCTKTTEYPKHPDRYGAPSPTCGYTYQKRSKPGHDYTVTASTHWRVSWATGGHSGTLTTTYAGRRMLPIGELQALIRG
ncbi:MAG: hypothetical protein J0I14_18850 [Propionibacteriaceae bacterium]|nr:hypothetical protein [Propionibacteriaceae bacterium]